MQKPLFNLELLKMEKKNLLFQMLTFVQFYIFYYIEIFFKIIQKHIAFLRFNFSNIASISKVIGDYYPCGILGFYIYIKFHAYTRNQTWDLEHGN